MDEENFGSWVIQFFGNIRNIQCILNKESLIIEVDKNWLDEFGFSHSDIIGRSIKRYVYNEDIEELDEIFKSSSSNSNHLIRFRNKSNNYEAYNCHFLCVKNFVFVSASNISRIKEFEQSLKINEDRNKIVTSLTVNYAFEFLVKDDNTLELVYVSDNIEKITGRTKQEASNIAEWINIFHPEDYKKVMELLQNLMQNDSVHEVECRTIVKGKMRWINIIAKSNKDEKTGRTISITGAVKDISDRKKVEEALKEGELRYRALIESQSDLISRYLPDTILTYVNDAYCEFYGKTREELIGNSFLFMISPEFREIVRKETEELARTCNSVQGEYLNIRHDGRECWINWVVKCITNDRGDVVELQAVGRDLTERKRTEQALQQSEQRFSDIFNLSPSMIGISRQSDDIILDVNKEIIDITGFERDEIIGKTTDILKLWAIAEERQKIVIEMREKGEVRNFEFKMRIKNGTILTCIISAKKHIFNNENCYLWVINDISERKKNEDQIKEARDRAEKSDKLKEVFLQNLSHEIRTPLNSIVGFSDLLSKEPNRPIEEIKKYTSIISNNSNQLLSIVTDVLTIASIQTGQVKVNYKNVDINKFFDQLNEIFSRLAKSRDIRFICSKEIETGPLIIKTDEIKLNQILTNMLNNAFKFTHSGCIELKYNIRDKFINFYVKDTGIGITKESQKMIFERFIQAEPSISIKYGGTGLGLSISKSFAQMLGGDIKVTSEPEVGSEFIISIPYNPVVIKPQIVKTKYNLTGENYNILVADDELDNYLFLEAALESDNIKIFHAKNGQEALEILNKNHKIDLILLDIKMPVMDGITAFKEIRKINLDVPVIAQTAYAISYEKQQLLDLGFNEYVSKPINSMELIEKINKILTL